MPGRMPGRALAALALAAALAGCRGPGDDPVAAPPEPAAASEAAPDVRQTPGTTGPGPTGVAGLVGAARVEDPAGDVADDSGNPPGESQPAADLRAVELTGDGRVLTVVFELDGPVPRAAGSLVWSVEVALNDTPEYEITAQLVGGRLLAAVFDWREGAQEPLPDPVVEGARLSLTVPRELLGRVQDGFRWRALTQLDGGYEDRAPEGASERSAFPQG